MEEEWRDRRMGQKRQALFEFSGVGQCIRRRKREPRHYSENSFYSKLRRSFVPAGKHFVETELLLVGNLSKPRLHKFVVHRKYRPRETVPEGKISSEDVFPGSRVASPSVSHQLRLVLQAGGLPEGSRGLSEAIPPECQPNPPIPPRRGGRFLAPLPRCEEFPTLYRRSALRSDLRLPSDNPPGC